ncbi:efflux RND transporter periplasmic adaptor subunit [Microvirga makkahensis]|uniref:Efflux RND transporter periplasmic adaptor subunit n=1 Tax=Microvirga makkahensis TaxID=1128670 RepID=A0A7X3MS97_9HYPH|nr:efflux RND transporter periplasmic adaptor subunit [Microvirga makkahensis]MXQ12297.1 efflux RND transporter periplasmic adaptor subunit [Microvirga makkahensis]
MFTRSNGALRRLQAMLIGLGLLTTIATAAVAHEGHDHGSPPPAAVTTNNPRVTAQSDAYELVGVLRGERLGIFLDRFASNEPVTDARITVTIGGDEEAQAEAAADGTFAVASPKFAGEGPLELIFAVTAPSGDDLLIGTLQLPAKAVATAPTPARGTPLQVLQNTPTVRLGSIEVATPYVIAGVALALGFLLGLVARGRRKLVPVAGLALVVLVVSAAYAFAHEGHDHGAEAAKAALPAGDTPRRLPDGTVFVPKRSQRLLNVRTTLTKPEDAQKAVSLIGRVIADPNRSGLVQSINGGRIIAPEKGLPRIGQAVRKGDVLALVEQAVPQADRTTLSERVGEIEQEIAVAETKLKRVRQLSDRGVAPPSQVTDAETELEGLRRRREIVRQTRIEPEVLLAPVDGTIAAARVVAGQVVASQDVIFQIVDPKGLWVEALVYGEIDPAKVTGASATAVDGTPLKLAFQGFSKALQQQASVVQFAVENPPGNLSVGSPVTVFAQNGASVRDIIMPRDAVVRGANGEAVVWRHTDPERFEARPVRTEPFDATRLVIRAGVAEGERIVVRGSELINQIR